MRPLWMALAAVLVLTAVVVVVEVGEPDLVPVGWATGEVTIVGELTMDQAGPVPDMVTAHATISADRAVVLPALVVRVRDEAGRDHDFPRREDVALGTTPTEITFRRDLAEPGTYTYSLAYSTGGAWVDLPPWQRVTIR
ncbi:hypothetical protein [Actinophytocola sp. NPDC049390]|uniref:hypothetical protein n=1 Tax=Actinophytocola sp. NPDC049390 TaxID=3363894 RepID=UPI00379022B8